MCHRFDYRSSIQIAAVPTLTTAYARLRAVVCVASVLGLLFFASIAVADTTNQMYEKVFGPQDPAAEVSIPVEVMFDGRESGLATLLLAADGSFRVETEALIAIVAAIANDKTLSALEALATASRLAPPTVFNALGLQLDYEPATLRLNVRLAPENRKRTNIAIRDGMGRDIFPQAAAFSLYTNIHGSTNYTHANSSGLRSSQSSSINFEIVARLHDWVIESEAFYQSATEDHWRRGGLRLVRDNIDQSTRLVIGDQSWPAQPLMGSHQLAGVTLSKNFAIQPYMEIQPSGYHEFLVNSASTVEIFVNDVLQRTLALDPGTYSFSDLPLTYGTNQFRLRIVDAFGQESFFDVDVYSADRLLAKGLTEFALSAGMRSSHQSGGLKYDAQNPLLAGFFRAGVSDTTTLGVASRFSRRSWLMSGQAVLATRFGNFAANVAAGQEYHADVGYATQLGYRHYQKLRPGQGIRSWDFSALLLSGDYLGAMTETTAPGRHSLSLRMAQPLTVRSYISLSANYQSRHESPDVYSAALSFSHRLRSGLTVRLSGYRYSGDDKTPGTAFSLSFSVPFDDGKQNVQGNFDSRNNRRSASWQRSPDSSDFGLSGSLGYSEDRDNRLLDGLLAFNGSRIEARLSHNYVHDLLHSSGVTQFTRVNFSTALAVAGGRFAITRHIVDSFAIAVPHENYSRFDIGLKRRNGERESTSGLFGAAITSGLTSYETHQLEVYVAELPLGYDLQDTNPTVTPKYRSGVVVAVGNAASIILRGRLVTPEGAALKLRSGVLTFLGSESSEPIRFFTNRNGKFTVSGIQPGPYEILLESSGESVDIQVPSDAHGVLNYGEIRL